MKVKNIKYNKTELEINIITFYWNSINYGGLLQSYALCKFLKKNGYSVRQISYKKKVKYNYTKSLLKIFIALVPHTKYHLDKKIRKKFKIRKLYTKEFRDGIQHTKVYNLKTIKKIPTDNRIFIAGSDQIWNPYINDDAYLLSFLNEKVPKISYAASIGIKELTVKQQKKIISLISRFDFLSMREVEGKNLIQKKIEKEIKIVVDPTLLLGRQDWDEIAITSNNYTKYIFVYLLGDNLEHREKIKKIAKILNLKIVTIPHVHMRYEVSDEEFADIEVYDAGPREFIGWIKNANMIITDSFHGTVFSILYEKSFWTFRRNIDSDPKNMNSRLYSLFENVGIQNRFLDEIDDLNSRAMVMERINYKAVNKRLDMLRNDSSEWLESALKESEEKL